jgi:uncharacterized protein (UPF0332 family)
VSDHVTALVARARREIVVVRDLSSAGHDEQATSRAYYAAFYAAQAALLTHGETRSKHSGVISAFGRLVIRDGGLDPTHGRTLRQLFEGRNAADYDWLDEREDPVDDPAAKAERFVDAVEAWIAERP